MSDSFAPQKGDAELIWEFKNGEEAAFEELVRRHKEKAMKLAYVTVGNYEDAKEISQDAFVKAYRGLKDFELRSKFSTWFYRILMNTAKDYLRKRKWKNFLNWKDPEEMETFFENLTDQKASPNRIMQNRELGEKITEAIKGLPPKQRWIFSLRHLEGLSIQEIAEAADLSEGTVKAALHFASQKFKEKVQPYLKRGAS
jgi:RNA polymerase sigma-70 factor (ECF subfamily)